MGFNVSYHPIKEQETKEWYFDVLNDESKINNLTQMFELDDFYKQKYADMISAGKNTQTSDCFDITHGFYIAAIQGFFRTHFFTRGSAFSFLVNENPDYKKYTKSWQEILKTPIDNPIHNMITENYSSGVYISASHVHVLLGNYQSDERVKQELDNFYSHNRIDVFLKALRYCAENDMGLLEAADVVEPNPLNLNESKSYSNLFNCDTDGALLYEKAVLEQISVIEEENKFEKGTIAKDAEFVVISVDKVEEKEKKGIWKRLFGK